MVEKLKEEIRSPQNVQRESLQFLQKKKKRTRRQGGGEDIPLNVKQNNCRSKILHLKGSIFEASEMIVKGLAVQTRIPEFNSQNLPVGGRESQHHRDVL